MSYTLTGADGRPYTSARKGTWGGHRGGRIYGRLDCPAALRAIARGGYVKNRVFFANEGTAVAAGYRPCGACCRELYQAWKGARDRGEPWSP
ncbi:Ada metal-binding domain-containing protein [Kribbia dieselivorans]|uniref:Ada metal-binding domain-containing protein n=1 Tax=Kribbia dieselivorans TaxID=331526 RepID=UPI0009FB87B0|nr:Ada metal-binding domain-containing protein [Kribbia dieselivorans]